MTDGKTWGDTVLGWFVVRDSAAGDGDAPSSASAVAAPAAGAETPTADLPSVEPVAALPAAPGGVVDFDGVFAAFGIDAEARDRLAKGEGLLKSLPAGTDPAVQRAIVEASLKAFGVPIEQIIETACEEVQALAAYQKNGDMALQAFSQEAGRQIAEHEQQIAAIRGALQTEIDDQKRTVDACNQKKLQVQAILEFFGAEAVSRVVQDSPRLIDPKSPPAAGAH